MNQISFEDINIGLPILESQRTAPNGYTYGFGYSRREVFGNPGAGDEYVDPPPGSPPVRREPIFIPRRRDAAFGQVIKIGDRARNFSYALSARLRKRFGDRLSVDVGYAFNRSADVRSLGSWRARPPSFRDRLEAAGSRCCMWGNRGGPTPTCTPTTSTATRTRDSDGPSTSRTT
ncbi:hypothetical protein [Candidatus Palauibacter sp.]|uniref:hypothetical protein n=1 Tax=Candidatus Palauibacter sp. TaxID=3101350 RepID=UPI003AF29197